jgi:hypothetical protein
VNSTHLSALSLTFIIYAILAIAYFGWGKAITYLLGLNRGENHYLTADIWMGWAFCLLLFQLIHFVLPITAFVVVPVLLIGITFAVLQILKAYRHFTDRRSILMLVVWFAIAIVVSAWIASRSMVPPDNYDAGLYYFNKMRWINTFPIVPGLGNLYGRLAFNHSFFTYAAALNLYPFFGHGRSIANSFLLLLTVATFIDFLRPAIKQPSLLIESHPFQYTSIIILFPALAYLAFSSNGLSSPSPDLTSTLLQLTMMILLIQGIGEWQNGRTDQKYRAVYLSILAITAVTVKLSNLAFSATIIGFIVLYTRKSPATQLVVRTTALSVIMILVWCLQSIVLSGAPLYPSTIGYLPVEWAVPIEEVAEEARWVYSWARYPGPHWRDVLGNWNWITPWLIRMFKDNLTNVVYPLIVAVLFFVITFAISRTKKCSSPRYLEWAILFPPVIGLIYWFFSAPEPRFAHALFLIISMCSILLFLISIQNISNRRVLLTLMCIAFVIANIHFIAYFVENRVVIKSISGFGWYPVKTVPLDIKVTSSGLSVYTPQAGDQSWDSPLPSTPYFDSRLKLRNPESMSSGFTTTR